ARILADRERVGYRPRVWLTPQALRELRTLVRDRPQRVAQRRHRKLAIGTRLREQRQRGGHARWTTAWRRWIERHAQPPEQARWVRQQRRRRLEWVQQEMRAVEQRLAQVTPTDTPVGGLRTIKAIGPVTAWTVRAESGRFDRFRSGQQRARCCGLRPCHRSSGDKQADAGLLHAANPERRRVVIEAAWFLVRLPPRWRDLAERLRARGKPSTVVVAAA